MTDLSYTTREWLIDLSTRVNLLNVHVPYIPLLLKDITAYVQSSDYESNRVRTIQTIGHLRREEDIIKIVDIGVKGVEFRICLNQLPITNIYFDIPRNNCNSIWDYNAVRIYGTLVKEGAQISLNVVYIFEVENAIVLEKLFETLSKLARKGYHQYFSRTEIDKFLDMQGEIECL